MALTEPLLNAVPETEDFNVTDPDQTIGIPTIQISGKSFNACNCFSYEGMSI